MRRAPFLLLLLAACREDEAIRHYQVPKGPPPPVRHAHQPEAAPDRMLAAMITRDDQTWFFKVTAASVEIESIKPAFVELIASLRFAPDPEWTLPPGWRTEPGSEMRYATIVTDEGLGIGVFAFDRDGGGVLGNINRWRGQLGLGPIAEADLSTITQSVGDAIVVDIGEGPARSIRDAFAFDLPAGWTETPQPSGNRIMEFDAGGAEVTLTVLSGTAGGFAANVNRWRQQIGLEPEADPQAETILLLKGEGLYVKLDGPENAIRAAVIMPGSFTMFFKMMGPTATVAAQTEAFEAWLASLRPVDE